MQNVRETREFLEVTGTLKPFDLLTWSQVASWQLVLWIIVDKTELFGAFINRVDLFFYPITLDFSLKEHRYIELFLNSTPGGGSGMGGSGMGGYGRDGMGM